ncbi:hypothetical protein FRB91_004423, partial [Serendipita sp. 411]
FRDLLDHGASNKQEAEQERLRLEREAVEKEIAAKEAEEKASIKGKFKGIFTSDAEEAAEHQRLVDAALAKRREAEAAKHREESFSHKIKDVFDGDNEEKERERQRLAEEAKRNQSFGARVRNIFHNEPPAPPPKKDWKDKLNEMAGGGAKSEAKEGMFHFRIQTEASLASTRLANTPIDHLDKTIDFVQEHVLHKGDQKNESAFEQAKDNQIADALRGVFGQKKDKDDK